MAFQPVRGISADHVTNIPEQWSKQWFRGFIRNHLEQMDVRNAVAGPGVTISSAAAANSHTLLARGKISVGGSGGVPLNALASQAPFTFVANNTAGSAPPTAIDGAAATSMLSLFSPALKGLVPASGGGTTNFLRADGSFASPSPLTTKGDLFTFSTVNDRLAVGADGLVLSADSTQATGLKWVAAGGGSGTVTSVGLADGSGTPIYTISGSPVIAAGTLTFTLANQLANAVFAGPTSGGAAQPGFRALVAADVPSSILPGSFSGFANPSGLIGMTAVNGVATTADRSDSTHAIDPAISPTWTGTHEFTVAPIFSHAVGSGGPYGARFEAAGAAGYLFKDTAAAADAKSWENFVTATQYILRTADDAGASFKNLLLFTRAANVVSSLAFGNATDNPSYTFLGTGTLTTNGAVVMNAAAAANTLTVNGTGINRAALFQGGTNPNIGVTDGTITVKAQVLAGVAALIGTESNHEFRVYTNNTQRWAIAADGHATISIPTAGIALTVNGLSATDTMQIIGGATSGSSFGVTLRAGTTAADYALRVLNQATTVQFLKIFGDGHGALGPTAALGLSWDVNGAETIAAPAAGVALTVNAIAGSLGIDAQNGVRAPVIVVDRQFTSEGDISANGSCVVDEYMQLGAGKIMNIGTGGVLSIGIQPAATPLDISGGAVATAAVNRRPTTSGRIPPNYNLIADEYMQLDSGILLLVETGALLSLGLQPVAYLPTNGIFNSSGQLAA